jgi:hypothetical protein
MVSPVSVETVHFLVASLHAASLTRVSNVMWRYMSCFFATNCA